MPEPVCCVTKMLLQKDAVVARAKQLSLEKFAASNGTAAKPPRKPLTNGSSTFTYDAAGNKIRKVSVISGTTTTTEYISGIQYKNSTTAIDFIQTEEGRTTPNGSAAYDWATTWAIQG